MLSGITLDFLSNVSFFFPELLAFGSGPLRGPSLFLALVFSLCSFVLFPEGVLTFGFKSFYYSFISTTIVFIIEEFFSSLSVPFL